MLPQNPLPHNVQKPMLVPLKLKLVLMKLKQELMLILMKPNLMQRQWLKKPLLL